MTPESSWITWEKHQRSRSLTTQLCIPLFELSQGRGRLGRYLRNSLSTVKWLFSHRHRVVFVQAPSVVLAHLVLAISAVMRFRVVVDAHNAVVEGAEHASQPLRWLYRSVIRRADVLIVTNSSLAERVRKLGGMPGILPDPVPAFRAPPDRCTTAHSVVVISTWAADEPIGEILEAARQLPDFMRITVTGRPKGPFADLARSTPNVSLSGFVSDEEYLQLLGSAAVVVDLTTREDCLVCGAYEALALGRPLVVSDSRALRELLRDGALFSANQPAAIARTVIEASTAESEWAQRCANRRESYLLEWREAAERLSQQVAALR